MTVLINTPENVALLEKKLTEIALYQKMVKRLREQVEVPVLSNFNGSFQQDNDEPHKLYYDGFK